MTGATGVRRDLGHLPHEHQLLRDDLADHHRFDQQLECGDLLSRLREVLRRLRERESGITLIELLVAMSMGIIVSMAAYAILTTTLRETSRVFTRVDATQRSRLTMENIETLLHSSCLADGTKPIISTTSPSRLTTATTMYFVSRYGSQTTPTPTLHKIALSGTNLTDTTYALTSGTGPSSWVFSTTASGTTTLLTNVRAAGSTPMFQYFAFEPAADAAGHDYQDDSGNPLQMLLDGSNSLPTGTYTSTGTPVAAGTYPANSPDPLPVPLSTTDAQAAAEVLITMDVGPSGAGTNNTFSDYATISNSVVLRLTPVVSDGTNNQQVAPCD